MRSALIGRGDDLRRAGFALSERGVVVLAGPSGVGKTALCDFLAADWKRRGGQVHELRGTHGLNQVPFGALTMALRVDMGDSDTETLARVVSMLTQGDERAMVVVDDVHLLDSQSAGLVSGLAHASDVALALAITSGESVSADITSVWARWPDSRIEVEPLVRNQVGELMEVLLGQAMTEEDVDEITAVSLGYPLYVTAIAAELRAREDTELKAVLQSGARSDRLLSLMERRLARLSRDQRRLFDAIAYAETTSARIALAGDDETLLEQLDDAGLVRRMGDRVQVSHPLMGSVSRATLTHEGQRANARRLVKGLNDSSEARDVAAVVRKALGAGVVPPIENVRTAGEVALSWGDFEGVARLTSLVPDDPGLRVLRAQAARFLGETPTTEIPVGLEEAALTEFLSGTSQGIAYGERRFTDAINFLKEGMGSLTQPEHRNRLAMELMVLSGLVGDMDALLGAARAVNPSADFNTRLLALSATQLGEALTLSTATSDETYERGRAIARDEDVGAFLLEQLEMSRVMVELAEGRFSAAQARAAAFEDRTLIGSWLTIEAVLADAWLSLSEASELADSAVSGLEQFDPLGNLAQARIVADLRRAQLGMVPVDDQPAHVHEPGVAEIDRIMDERVDAWLAWGDDEPTAGKRLVEVGREAISMGHRFWGLSALVDAIRLGHGDDVIADIEHLVITRGAGLAVLAGRYARASSPDELWASARMWWSAGAPVYGIESAIRGTDPANPIQCLGVRLMTAREVRPVVGNLESIPWPVSERQLEIVSRVLDGQSNAEIAEETFLSRRTVENHLHRLYSGLGIAGGREGLLGLYGWIGPREA